MKKLLYLFGAMALMAGMVACGPDEESEINWDEVVDKGVYVVGEATGSDQIQAAWGMAVGRNEAANNEMRTGMYEKYVWLEANKPFTLVNYVEEGNQTTYSSLLDETRDGSDSETYAEHPAVQIRVGELIQGGTEVMTVAETGLYHIVLDLNEVLNDQGEPQLAYPQIVVAPAEWGIRGDMNSWGFTKADMVRAEDGTITYTCANQVCAAGKFKFAYGGGWKIQLDAEGKVKANTNLGADMVIGGSDIQIEQAGIYDIVLTYKNAGGDAAKSFSYKVTYKGEVPSAMAFVDGENKVDMVPVNGKGGQFWLVRKLTAGTTYKVNITMAAGEQEYKDITVDEDGLYRILVNYAGDSVDVVAAEVYGIGDAFGSWDAGKYPFTINADGTATITTTAGGNLRMYVPIPGVDWWQAEFNIYDGEIAYRGTGGDQTAVPVTAGQTVTLNFNEGTGSIN